MLSLLRRKQLPERVLILCALPCEARQFAGSDFADSLRQGRDIDIDELWQEYRPTALQIIKTMRNLSKQGAETMFLTDISDLRHTGQYDVTVIIAHHVTDADAIEIGERAVVTQAFVEAFPNGLHGIVDLTSCYSASLLPKLKVRHPDCRFIGIDIATSLSFRLLLLEHTLRQMSRGKRYIEALNTALSEMGAACRISDCDMLSVRKGIMLGGNSLRSSVYAPAAVARGNDFLVQIFIHSDADSEQVRLSAEYVDSDTGIRNSRSLAISIRHGDIIEFQLLQVPRITDGVFLDNEARSAIWDGQPISVEFAVGIPSDYPKDAFLGKVKIAVNKLPAGDILFKTAITDNTPATAQTDNADIDFIPHDSAASSRNARESLSQRLIKARRRIAEGSTATSGRDIEICDKCLELLSHDYGPDNSIKQVFISSTSDMRPYRLVVKEQVDACRMYADMYELWGQNNQYPRDSCVRHVMQSDIYIGILGASYGFVENEWQLSMTEIEYRIAECCNMPTLIYVDNEWRRKIDALRKAGNREAADCQQAFIEEVVGKRLVSFFSNETNLALKAIADLSALNPRRSL